MVMSMTNPRGVSWEPSPNDICGCCKGVVPYDDWRRIGEDLMCWHCFIFRHLEAIQATPSATHALPVEALTTLHEEEPDYEGRGAWCMHCGEEDLDGKLWNIQPEGTYMCCSDCITDIVIQRERETLSREPQGET